MDVLHLMEFLSRTIKVEARLRLMEEVGLCQMGTRLLQPEKMGDEGKKLQNSHI